MARSVEEAERGLDALGVSPSDEARMRARAATWRFDGLEAADQQLEALAEGRTFAGSTAAQAMSVLHPATGDRKPLSNRAAPPSIPVAHAPVATAAKANEESWALEAEEIDAQIGDFFGDISVPPPAGEEAVAVEQGPVSDAEVDALLDGFSLDDDDSAAEGQQDQDADADGKKGYFGKIFG